MPFPGFIYWGVFLVCGGIWIAYAIWMVRANGRDTERPPEPEAEPPA